MSQGGLQLGILQPGYLPWLGFFDQMSRNDVFVFYDDVQFDKHGWRNRNRIKSPAGPHWLAVPVRHKGLGKQSILEVEIDNSQPWTRKHIGTMRQLYAGAPYLGRYLPELEELLNHHWERLVDLDLAVIELMCAWLGLHCRTVRSSELGVHGERSERLLKICQHFGAERYLTGTAGKTYLDTELFLRNGVEVQWQDYQHPAYPQQHGEFVPYLSTLDLVFNCGDESLGIIAGAKEIGAGSGPVESRLPG